MNKKAVTSITMIIALLMTGLSLNIERSSAVTSDKVVKIDGKKANTDSASLYRGFGLVAGNGSSRLLLDYKDEQPKKYWEILNYLFNTETGLGISHIKIEMGSDVNSSSGTEPSLMRTENEKPDATRGANFQFAADAKTINPNITLDMLWWSEPLWVTNSKDVYAARYKWYKGILEAAYKAYGLKFDYVSANRNEKPVDAEWIKYLSRALKSEKDSSYDYKTIKIVAADENTTWDIAKKMMNDKELLEAVDVIGSHYTSWSSDAAKTIKAKYGKEIWFTEGCAPMSYSKGTYRYDGTGSGISDINGMLDIATRIITMYPGGSMNLYEFQPAVASYYSGSTYFPKQLITANEPWSGYYTLDEGFYMGMHFSQFAKFGWQFIDGACEGDGVAGGDGHAIVNSTYNYMTLTDPNTGDYSIIIANNTANPLTYSFQVSNLDQYGASVDVWETRGPDDDTDYYQNYLKKIETISPDVQGKKATYKITVKPYSLVTVTTLGKEETKYASQEQSEVLSLPYSDDFEYKDYDKKYLADRGAAPRYTADEGGAFEVVTLKGNRVIQQKVTYDIKAEDWGSTPYPVTNLGDDRWTNYSVSVDVLFSTKNTGKKQNYVGVGARYTLPTAGRSGYWLQLLEDGNYKLLKDSLTLAASEKPLKDFKKASWYNLKLSVNKNVITCYINNKKVIEYTDKQAISASGRVALYSEFNTNYFDNLKVEPIKGATTYSDRIDDTDAPISYKGDWEHNTMSSFRNHNRTISTGTKGASLSFSYTGEGFAVLGALSKDVKIKVEIDGKVVEKGYVTASTKDRQASYFNFNLKKGNHKVKITVLSGKFAVDAIEFVGGSIK